MSSNTNKSVIVFYSINYNTVATLNYDEVWHDYVIKYLPNIYCKNIAYFDLSPSSLANLLRNGTTSELEDILDATHIERADGSNFIFVKPVNGRPIDGVYIPKFLTFSRRVTSGGIKPAFRLRIPK